MGIMEGMAALQNNDFSRIWRYKVMRNSSSGLFFEICTFSSSGLVTFNLIFIVPDPI